jgi:hypothetical protein
MATEIRVVSVDDLDFIDKGPRAVWRPVIKSLDVGQAATGFSNMGMAGSVAARSNERHASEGRQFRCAKTNDGQFVVYRVK